MVKITVISKAERTEAFGKLLIGDFLEEMKEPGHSFKSDIQSWRLFLPDETPCQASKKQKR